MDAKEYERLRKEKSYKRIIAESILDFRLLRKNNVLARRGKCIDMIDEDIEKVFVLCPKIIYMEFGKNDILHFHKDVKAFISVYAEKILKIKDTTS